MLWIHRRGQQDRSPLLIMVCGLQSSVLYITTGMHALMVVFVVLSGGNLTTQFFPDVFGHLLVWENTALYYSPNTGDI